MTVYRPTADDLLEALGEYLGGDLAARVEGADVFHLRVAANVLEMVRREMAEGPGADARAAARYAALLGREAGPLRELAAAVCDRLRTGRMAPDDPQLLAALRETAAERIAIDNPRYASLRLVRNST